MIPRQYSWGNLTDKLRGPAFARDMARRVALERQEDVAIKFFTMGEVRYIHPRWDKYSRNPVWYEIRFTRCFRLHPLEIAFLTEGGRSVADGIHQEVEKYLPPNTPPAMPPAMPIGGKVQKLVQISPVCWDRLGEIGDGNRSIGLRIVIAPRMRPLALRGDLPIETPSVSFWLTQEENDLVVAMGGIRPILDMGCGRADPTPGGVLRPFALEANEMDLLRLSTACKGDPNTGLRRLLAGLICAR